MLSITPPSLYDQCSLVFSKSQMSAYSELEMSARLTAAADNVSYRGLEYELERENFIGGITLREFDPIESPRHATTGDSEPVAKLLATEDPVLQHDERQCVFTQELRANKRPLILDRHGIVALHEDAIIGCVLANIQLGALQIRVLYVHPDYRKRGVATRMIRFFASTFRDKPIHLFGQPRTLAKDTLAALQFQSQTRHNGWHRHALVHPPGRSTNKRYRTIATIVNRSPLSDISAFTQMISSPRVSRLIAVDSPLMSSIKI